jgi:hypothetical protein
VRWPSDSLPSWTTGCARDDVDGTEAVPSLCSRHVGASGTSDSRAVFVREPNERLGAPTLVRRVARASGREHPVGEGRGVHRARVPRAVSLVPAAAVSVRAHSPRGPVGVRDAPLRIGRTFTYEDAATSVRDVTSTVRRARVSGTTPCGGERAGRQPHRTVVPDRPPRSGLTATTAAW